MRLLSRSKPAEEANPNPQLERGAKETCLATFWHQATPGTTYWRCLVPARHLPGQTIPVTPSDLQVTKKGEILFPRQRGAAVFQFLGDRYRSKFAFAMRDITGSKLVLEVDDNYTRFAPYMLGRNKSSPWVKTIAEADGGYSHEQHKLLLPEVDHIICSTDFLADVYSEYNDNVSVCPNSIDPDDWQYEREEHDAFRIVYYGSSSHTKDTPLVTDALKWASKQDGVEVWTVGFKNPAWSFPYQMVPWNAFLEPARQNLFKFDVGIAPLTGNPWSRGKSDVKALEYAMAGVMPIVQDEVPYSPWKDAGWDWMCSTKGDWMEAIQEIVRNRDDVPEIAASAKAYVLGERTIESTIDRWKEAVDA